MSDEMEAKAKQFLNEGIAKAKKGDSQGAIREFMKVVNFYPESDVADNAHYNLGQIYLKQGDTDRAYCEFKIVVERYPDSDAALFAGDMMQECQHQADPSCEVFDRAQQAFSRGDLSAARALYEQLVTESPDSNLADNAHFALGMLGRRLKDEALAKKHFEIVRTRYPDSDAAQLLEDAAGA